jgi:hypothetical protein
MDAVRPEKNLSLADRVLKQQYLYYYGIESKGSTPTCTKLGKVKEAHCTEEIVANFSAQTGQGERERERAFSWFLLSDPSPAALLYTSPASTSPPPSPCLVPFVAIIRWSPCPQLQLRCERPLSSDSLLSPFVDACCCC